MQLDGPASGPCNEHGMTILLVEHVMELVMGVTDRIAVLNFGQQDRRRRCRPRSGATRRCSTAYLGGNVGTDA